MWKICESVDVQYLKIVDNRRWKQFISFISPRDKEK